MPTVLCVATMILFVQQRNVYNSVSEAWVNVLYGQ